MTDRRPRGPARRAALAAGALWLGLAGAGLAQHAPLSGTGWTPGKTPAPPTISGWRPGDPVPPDAARRRPASAAAATGHAPDLAQSGAPGRVAVSRLGEADPDAAGMMSARSAGLPMELWAKADSAALIAAWRGADPRLPALRDLARRMLVAQLTPPPRGTTPPGDLLLARVDRLTAFGEVAAARALIRAAGTSSTAQFQRLFDLDLLTGDVSGSCALLAKAPGLAPDLAVRSYCLAQQGDWATAAVALQGGLDLGLIAPQTGDLLTRYLDDSYADVAEAVGGDGPMTPLLFRLSEAIGQPVATTGLPLPYAVADLTEAGGWKARLEAAERLARAGSLRAEDLATAYAEQKPAASGGVWDRAALVQRLTAALEARDGAALATALPEALDAFGRAGLAPVLARMVAPSLPEAPPEGAAALPILRMRLLAGLPVTAPPGAPPLESWLAALSRDRAAVPPPPEAVEPRLAALAAALTPAGEPVTPDGLALLAALADVDAGLDGDTPRAARGLAALVAAGQAATARQAAVELLLLPPAGARHAD